MNALDLITTASRNLGRNKVRSALTVLAIFIGTLSIALTIGMGMGVSRYVDKQLANLGAQDELQIRPRTDYGPGGPNSPRRYNPDRVVIAGRFGINQMLMTAKDVAAIRAQPGIISAQPDLNAIPDYLQGPGPDKYQFGLAPLADGTALDIEAGKLADNNSLQPQIVLPTSFPKPLGFRSNQDAINKRVTVAITDSTGARHHVTAIVTGVRSQTLVNTNSANVNQALLKKLHGLQTQGLPDIAKSTYQTVTAHFDPSLSSQQLQTVKDGLYAKGYLALTVKDRIGIFKQVVSAITVVLACFGAVALFAASLGIVNTLFMTVQERTREIGLMKAVGMGNRKMFLLFSIEAVLLGFWGSALGILATLAVGLIANDISARTFLASLPGLRLTAFSVSSLLAIVVIIMVVAFLAGTLPARKAARHSPIEALRNE